MKKILIILSLLCTLSLNATDRTSFKRASIMSRSDDSKTKVDRVRDLEYIPSMSQEISRNIMLDTTAGSRDVLKTDAQKNKALSRDNVNLLVNSSDRSIPTNITKVDIILSNDRDKTINYVPGISQEVSRSIMLDKDLGKESIELDNSILEKSLTRNNIDYIKHSNERITLKLDDKDLIKTRDDLEANRYNYFSRDNPILSSDDNPYNRDNLVRSGNERSNDILRKPFSRNNIIGLNHLGKVNLGYEIIYSEELETLSDLLYALDVENGISELSSKEMDEKKSEYQEKIDTLISNFNITKEKYSNPIPVVSLEKSKKPISIIRSTDNVSLYLYNDSYSFISIPSSEITKSDDRFSSEKYLNYFNNNRKYKNVSDNSYFSQSFNSESYVDLPDEIEKYSDRFTSDEFINYFEKNKSYDTDKLTMQEISDKIWDDNMTSNNYKMINQSRIIPHTLFWYLKRDYDKSTNLQKLVKIKKLKQITSD